MPNHNHAIYSAKLWYDAAYNLTKFNPSVFRSDDAIVEIMKGYEKKAEANKSFEKDYRKFVRPGYIEGMNKQLIGMTYAFIGEIPELVKQKRYDEAVKINNLALQTLSAEPLQTRQIVESVHGINIDLLKKNKSYLNQLNID